LHQETSVLSEAAKGELIAVHIKFGVKGPKRGYYDREVHSGE